jgi:uncharacterized oxidoreductase
MPHADWPVAVLIVGTTLAGPGSEHGAPLEEFCDTVFAGLVRGGVDVMGFGATAGLRVEISRQSLEEVFQKRAAMAKAETYTILD